jgi:hypothetical protein
MATEAGPDGSLSPGLVLTGLAVAAAAAALAVVGGLRGALVGAAVVGVWLRAGAPYAFVVGQVGLVVGLDGGLTTTSAPQAALVALLLVDVAAGRSTGIAVEAIGATGAAVGGLLAIYLYAEGTSLAAGLLLAATGLACYVLHRYQKVVLGFVGDPA